jgi:hypothetical protein
VAEREHLAAAADMMDPLVLTASKLSAAGLEARLSKAVGLVKKAVPLGPVALRAAAALPSLLGENGPVNYLVLAQNNDEIRATGGFITGIGIVTLNRGSIERFTISDSYDYDKFTVDHPFAPDPMQERMGIILWTTRDGNWSPDYPTTCRDTVTLFNLENVEPISGTIAFDMLALPPIIRAIEPITLPELDDPITAKNILSVVRESWAPDIPEGMTLTEWREQVGASGYREWWAHRKDLLGSLGRAMLSRLQGEGGFSQLGGLLRNVVQVLDQRHLLLNVDEPAVQDLIAVLAWDGSLRSSGGSDYLLAVDTNMGYNKVNLHVQRSLEYEVDLNTSADPRAKLTVRWNNPNPPVAECVLQSRYAATYDGMTRGCYWNYLRVYAPEGSRLGDTEGFTDTVGVSEELNKALFAGYVVVAAAEQRAVELEYALPSMADGEYRLVAQKQAGTEAVPLRVIVILPVGAQIQSISPQPSAVEGGRIVFNVDLLEDRTVLVQWH